jgi:hypothetical protein
VARVAAGDSVDKNLNHEGHKGHKGKPTSTV